MTRNTQAANANDLKADANPQPGAPAIAPAPAQAAPEAKPAAPRRRRPVRTLLMLAVPLALVVGGSYFWATGGRYEETDNANLRQPRVSVSADLSGRIVESHVSDNLPVKAGQTLFVVDPEPYRIALSQADAALANARLTVEQLRNRYSQAQAQQRMAQGDVNFLKDELDRQAALTKKGVGTQAALDSARRDLAKATDALASADETVAGALAALGGDASLETDKHPTVLTALAQRDKATLDLSRTTVKAPADGVLYQAASFQKGQLVAAGAPLFALVETGDNWIDANFKETQLTKLQVGQPAEVWFDAFPDQAFEATVEAIGAGTGAEFSLLPAQNATGNWVKVTQRIPVRLKLNDPKGELALRTGMSATVEVDTGHARGFGALANVPPFSWLAGSEAQAAQ
jgi:membrane fusion protein (multidrug efflux system)